MDPRARTQINKSGVRIRHTVEHTQNMRQTGLFLSQPILGNDPQMERKLRRRLNKR